MFRPDTAPAPRPTRPASTDHRRHRHPLVRRDPRRFARGIARLDRRPVVPAPAQSSDWRFFGHSFAGAFLFASVLIA
jgi:hypothetical protein